MTPTMGGRTKACTCDPRRRAIIAKAVAAWGGRRVCRDSPFPGLRVWTKGSEKGRRSSAALPVCRWPSIHFVHGSTKRISQTWERNGRVTVVLAGRAPSDTCYTVFADTVFGTAARVVHRIVTRTSVAPLHDLAGTTLAHLVRLSRSVLTHRPRSSRVVGGFGQGVLNLRDGDAVPRFAEIERVQRRADQRLGRRRIYLPEAIDELGQIRGV